MTERPAHARHALAERQPQRALFKCTLTACKAARHANRACMP